MARQEMANERLLEGAANPLQDVTSIASRRKWKFDPGAATLWPSWSLAGAVDIVPHNASLPLALPRISRVFSPENHLSGASQEFIGLLDLRDRSLGLLRLGIGIPNWGVVADPVHFRTVLRLPYQVSMPHSPNQSILSEHFIQEAYEYSQTTNLEANGSQKGFHYQKLIEKFEKAKVQGIRAI